jgi:hypothetical protein
MRRWTRLGAAVIVASALAGVLPPALRAHHSFAAEWDATKCREFTGTLTRLDWQNPHPYFFVDIKDASGKVENWSFQAYSPVTLRRNGTDRQVFLDNINKEVWISHGTFGGASSLLGFCSRALAPPCQAARKLRRTRSPSCRRADQRHACPTGVRT